MIQILVKVKRRRKEEKKTVNDDIRTPDPTTVTLHAITKKEILEKDKKRGRGRNRGIVVVVVCGGQD